MPFAANEQLVVDRRWRRIHCFTNGVGGDNLQLLGVLDHDCVSVATSQRKKGGRKGAEEGDAALFLSEAKRAASPSCSTDGPVGAGDDERVHASCARTLQSLSCTPRSRVLF